MKSKKYGDLLTGLFFLAIAIVYSTQIHKIKITKTSMINSAFFPKVLVFALVGLAIWQIAIGIKTMKSVRAEDVAETKERIDSKCVIMTFGLALVYVIILEPVGFLTSSILYLFSQMMVMCPKDKQRPVLFSIISVIASAIIYFVFRDGLTLMLPAGILEGIL